MSMRFRSLLVHLDTGASGTARVRLAAHLAIAWDCHLVGLAPTGLIDRPPLDEAATALTEYAGLAWDRLRARAEQCTEHFRAECRRAGVKSFEAVIDEAEKATSLVRHAHCSDLVVLSQSLPEAPDHPRAQHLVEQVVLNSARPTLVLPQGCTRTGVGDKVLVAWDDSAEAARALNDALPILCQSSHVQLVTWREDEDTQDPGLRARLDAVHQWLMWHGVSSEAHIEAPHTDLTEAMLSRATDMGADLIVMGAYGHPRWAERVLGGATGGMLAATTLPLLMSH